MTATALLQLSHANWELDLAPALGGRIFALRGHDGRQWRDLIAPVAPSLPLHQALARAGSYALVPFSNRIDQSRFSVAGRPVQLAGHHYDGPHAIHGLGWLAAWEVVAADARSARLRLVHDGSAWPWPFEVEQHFHLDADGLTVDLHLRNCGSEAMPNGLGFHPYFARPEGTRLHTRLREHWLCRPDIVPYGHEPLPAGLDFSEGLVLPTGLDDGFSGWEGQAVIDYGDWGIKLAAQSLPYMVIYSPAGGDFCCVEPIGHVTNACNLPEAEQAAAGWHSLPPGASRSVQMRIGLAK